MSYCPLIPSFTVPGAILPAPIFITDVELMKDGLIFLPCISFRFWASILMSTSLVALIVRQLFQERDMFTLLLAVNAAPLNCETSNSQSFIPSRRSQESEMDMIPQGLYTVLSFLFIQIESSRFWRHVLCLSHVAGCTTLINHKMSISMSRPWTYQILEVKFSFPSYIICLMSNLQFSPLLTHAHSIYFLPRTAAILQLIFAVRRTT